MSDDEAARRQGGEAARTEEDAGATGALLSLAASALAAVPPLLDRIATALERANEANPVDAINRALAAVQDGEAEEDQAWRLR